MLNPIMTKIEIPSDLAKLAAKQAALKGVSINQIVNDAILEYISEEQAIVRAEEVMSRIEAGEETMPWEDVKSELGL